MTTKLAIVTTHPIQYQAPLWRALAGDPDLDVHVYFGSDFSVRSYRDEGFGVQFAWDVPLTDGYNHTFLSTDPTIDSSSQLRLNVRDFRRRLREFGPDRTLLYGYSPFMFCLSAFAVLRSMGIPILFRGETTDEAVPRGQLKRLARYAFVVALYSQISAFLAVGYNSRHHYRVKRVPEARVFWSPYNIDSILLKQQAEKWRLERSATRRELGFGEDDTIFIFSGKLIAKKDPLTMAEAFRRVSVSGAKGIGLIVMGDGHLRPQVEQALGSLAGVKSTLVGFQNQSQLGRYYSAADCLILPSTWGETWGLVVNDALQFGLPAIVSDRVGCRRDLIVEDQTGYVFPCGDADALADRLFTMAASSQAKRETMRRACQAKAAKYSVEAAVAGIKQAALVTLPR